MAKKYVYSQGMHGVNDFIYIDLLPDVKRAGQFNIKVIIGLLFLIVSTFVLIFIPYSTRIAEYEELNSLNNDLKVELDLTKEEYIGFEINPNNIDFEDDIETIDEMRVDIKSIIDDIQLKVNPYNGSVERVSFNAAKSTISVDINVNNLSYFSSLNSDLLELPWVTSISPITAKLLDNGFTHQATFTLGVDYLVK